MQELSGTTKCQATFDVSARLRSVRVIVIVTIEIIIRIQDFETVFPLNSFDFP